MGRVDSETGKGMAQRAADAAQRAFRRAQARQRDEAAAEERAALYEASSPPDGASHRINADAPARGEQVIYTPMAMHYTGADGFQSRHDGYRGLNAMRARDAFDGKGLRSLDPSLIAVGRRYAALVERVEASGLSCSDAEPQHGGGAGTAGVSEAVLDDIAALRQMHHRIGQGISMRVRRIRPSERGSRRSISDRAVVDAICLGQMTLSGVLEAHGWASKQKTRAAVREALTASLARMEPVRMNGY